MPLVGIAAVATGFAIWKPVELSPLTNLLGGYVWARYWHFWAMLLLVILAVGHIFMVFSVDPYSIPSMITGNYREDLSPEARNARPFVHLLPPDKLSPLVPRDGVSHAAERLGIDRRRFLEAGSGALGALVLAACDSMGPKSAQSLLKFAERKNESIERILLRHSSMDVPRSSARAAGSHFPVVLRLRHGAGVE